MTALAAFPAGRSEARGDVVRWSASLVLVMGLHMAAVYLFLHRTPGETLAPPSEAVMIDLAPEPVSPAAEAEDTLLPEPPPQETAPAPEPMPTEPEPVPAQPDPPRAEPVATSSELPPEPAVPLPEVALPAPPPPTPAPPAVRHPARAQRPTIEPRRETAASPAPDMAPAAAAPPPAPAALSSAVPTWQGLMLGRLQRFKRYPDAARSNREEGVAYLTFSMDRGGRVLSATIARSSGSQALDAETLTLVHRAEPLPVPPPEMPGDPVTLTVPVRFSLR